MNSINAKEGEIRVFNKDGTAIACVFKDNKWDMLGEVLGAKNKVHYQGDRVFPAGEYDFVFDVDLEGYTSKLPFNHGDNCLSVAQKFISRENLHQLYIDDVTKFLRANTKAQTSAVPTQKTPSRHPVQASLSVKFPMVKFNILNSRQIIKFLIQLM